MLESLNILRWQDILDILVVAFIIHQLISIIRGTRSVQMVVGIGILTIIYFLAECDPGDVQLVSEDHCEARWGNAREAWELLTETSPEQLPALDAAVAYLSGRPC